MKLQVLSSLWAPSLCWVQIEFKCVSEKQPTPEQLEDLKFAWLCVKHVKSNAITGGCGKGGCSGPWAELC
mgnify:CR=1 FL=1